MNRRSPSPRGVHPDWWEVADLAGVLAGHPDPGSTVDELRGADARGVLASKAAARP